eukprot:IDg21854t1
MYDDIVSYCNSCEECQANKTPNLPPAGELLPHEIPAQCWDVVAADFVTELPRSTNGFDSVLVIIDKLSKRGIFIPTTKNVTAQQVAQLFQDRLFSLHGVPVKIISDRDPKFKSHYWASLTELLNVKRNMSTADHPQTDGQS